MLMEHQLILEDFGGDIQSVPVSALNVSVFFVCVLHVFMLVCVLCVCALFVLCVSGLGRGDCSWSSHASDLKIGTPMTTLPRAWHYKVSTGTGWPGVSIL